MHTNQNPTLIFINYRKSGSEKVAKDIQAHLGHYFAPVFLDVEGILAGDKWKQILDRNLEQAKVMLVLIHATWLSDQDALTYEPRIRQAADWVRYEIRSFLEQGKTLIPICIDEAPFPQAAQLVEDLKGLTEHQFLTLRRKHFHEDMEKVGAAIREKIGYPTMESTPKPTAPIYELSSLERTYPLPHSFYNQDHLKELKHPYVGLHYFTWKDAPIYFGRDDDIYTLIQKIENPDHALLLFYGPSGVGKSSLLNAGILPRIEARFQIDEIHRRDLALGLHVQLQNIQEKLQQTPTEKPVLVFLDQVEEIFTNKSDQLVGEVETFFTELVTWVRAITRQNHRIKIILSFRKEHLVDIRDPLLEAGINFQEHSLKVISKAGVRQAINGVCKDQRLNLHFRLHIETALVAEMADQIYGESADESHIAPLLQLQLRKMWDYLLAKEATLYLPERKFDLNLFAEFRHKALGDMIWEQVALVGAKWPDWYEGGLMLDLLNGLVTPKETATEMEIGTLVERYAHLNDLQVHLLIRDLTKAYLLFLKMDQSVVRLAHDQLGPIIRAAHQESDRPAQKAQRIIDAKKQIREREQIEFSEGDLAIIDAGIGFMPAIRTDLLRRMDENRRVFQQRRENRFAILRANARQAIDELKFEEAFKFLQLAAQEGLAAERMNIKAMASELPLLFAWQQQNEQCLEWAQWMVEQGFLDPQWKSSFPASDHLDFIARFKAWLQACQPEVVEQLLERHLPTMLSIAGGTFQMGSKDGWKHETPVHKVRLSDFQLGSTAVTFWQYGLYCRLTGRELPSDSGWGMADRPVINVNWFEAAAYCNWLSTWQGLDPVYEHLDEEDKMVICHWDRNGYRLPTEAEWEYAAREKGRKVRFGNGKDEASFAEMNYSGEKTRNNFDKALIYTELGKYLNKTMAVKSYAPNALGLFGMSGNTNEWCWDIYLDDSSKPSTYYKMSKGKKNPTGPEGEYLNEYRVVRGGSWYSGAAYCRCAYRDGFLPLNRGNNRGFRVARRAN